MEALDRRLISRFERGDQLVGHVPIPEGQMRSARVVLLPTPILLLTLLLAVGPAAAQELWPVPSSRATLLLEWQRPSVSGADLSTLSGMLRAGITVPIGATTRFVAVLPY